MVLLGVLLAGLSALPHLARGVADKIMSFRQLQPEIIFYTKPNCPLCEEAEEILEEMKNLYSITVSKIDITKDMIVYEEYKHKIPVIEIAQKFVLSGRIGKGKLRARIRQLQKGGKKS